MTQVRMIETLLGCIYQMSKNTDGTNLTINHRVECYTFQPKNQRVKSYAFLAL